jgi:hypothetical protein
MYRRSLLIDIFIEFLVTCPSHFLTILSAHIVQARTDVVVRRSRHHIDAMTGDRFVVIVDMNEIHSIP